MSFNAHGENLFVITVNCLGDWQRVTQGGPWLFRDHGVLIEAYDGFTKPEEIVMEQIEVWTQILDLPPLFRKEEVVRSMAKKMGKWGKCS